MPISPAGPAASRIKRERRMISGGVCRHLNHLEQRRLSKIGRFWRPWVSLVSARRGRVGQFCKGSPPSVREANFLLLSAYCMPAQTNSPLGPATSKSRKNIFVPSETVGRGDVETVGRRSKARSLPYNVVSISVVA